MTSTRVLNRIWGIVYNSSGVKIGEIREIANCEITKTLDEIGDFKATLASTNPDIFAVVSVGYRIDFYVPDTTEPRMIGSGIIREIVKSETSLGGTLQVRGPLSLDLLTKKSTLLARAFEDETIETIVDNLISLVGGWTAIVDDDLGTSTARFDGPSVFSALVKFAQNNGVHIRPGASAKSVEVGVFGADNGLTLTNTPKSITAEMYENDDLILIDAIHQTVSDYETVNWVSPLGAGEGAAALTLRDSTRLEPYPIQTMLGPDGSTVYYLTTTDVVGDQIEKIISFKDIGPVANSESAKILAANALYDATIAWLERNSIPLVTYSIACKKVRSNIYPGDKIRLKYKGTVRADDGRSFKRIDVNELFWVMSVTERFNYSGSSMSIEVASVDRMAVDSIKSIVGAIEDIRAAKTTVQTFPYWSENTWTDFVGNDWLSLTKRDAKFKLRVDDLVTDILSVKLNFKTRPLFFNAIVGSPSLSPWTAAYAIVEGDQHPKDLSLIVNGVDVSASYGGPWNIRTGGTPGFGWTVGQYQNNALDVEIDITNLIVDAAGGIYQDHSIVFRSGTDANAWQYVIPGHGTIGTGSLNGDATSGIVECNLRVLGIARALVPIP